MGCTTTADSIRTAAIACGVEAVLFGIAVAIYCCIQRSRKKKPKRVSPKERVAIYRPAHLKPDDIKNGYSSATVEFDSGDHERSATKTQHEVNENDYDVLWKWNPRLFKESESQGVYSHLGATDSPGECADTDQYDTTRRVLSARRARPQEELYNKMVIPDQ